MIDEIHVRDLALIQEATFVPSRGLTVVTGETGAGKTALLSALKLLMGARASADWVRDGESALSVSGRFFGLSYADMPDSDSAESADLPGETPITLDVSADEEDSFEAETVVTRTVGADGRSRARINGELASAKELAAVVAPSVDLCGQFEHQKLMRPASHVTLLDAWAGDSIAPSHRRYEEAFAAAQQAARELTRVEEAGALSSAKLDEARFTAKRIGEVRPEVGEYEQLSHDLEIAEHAEALAVAVGTAYETLSGDGGALDALNTAASALETAGRVDNDLAELAQSLREAGYVLEDVSAQSRDYRDRIEFDPAVLAQQQERYSQFQGLLRAYGPRMEDVFAAQEQALEAIALVDNSAERLRAAQKALEQAESALAKAADALDAARAKAAPLFADEVTKVMDRLEMGGAQLVCNQERLNRSSWTNVGPSAIEFLYRPAPDMQARPLARIASGGEVSRVMLACKEVLGAVDDVDTLVFDEVDAGVGGAVAVALGDVIAGLAQTHQVIVVTHLAQVAVHGDTHYVVQREGANTQLNIVSGDERVREIARMLSGNATDASIAHAREMLEYANEKGT